MAQVSCRILLQNPGINRMQSDRHCNSSLHAVGSKTLTCIDEKSDPWLHFLIWESEWHARLGIDKIRRAPFVQWGTDLPGLKVLELQQTHSKEFEAGKKSFSDDVNFVMSAIRQSKEYYTAALTVSELTRPTLVYYSAVMLAKALAVALFGADYVKTKSGHGLSTPSGGVDFDQKPTIWPTFVSWQRKGDFVALFQATRWDKYDWARRPMPKFHIIECLRSIGIVQSHPMLNSPRSLNHLLWSYPGEPVDILPTTVKHVLHNPVFEVPRVVVMYMVLFWLGVMARYHPAAWQELLAGKTEEGYFLRKAIDEVPRQFIQSMQEALPNPYFIKEAEKAKVIESMDPEELQCPYRLVVDVGAMPPPHGCEVQTQ